MVQNKLQPMGTSIFGRALLVEDDPAHALLIKRALKDVCSEVVHSTTAAQGTKSLQNATFEIIITDLQLPDATAAEHIEDLRRVSPTTPILVLTSSNRVEDAVAAMKQGAKDFLVKTFDSEFPNMLALSLARLYAGALLEEEKRRLQRQLSALKIAIEGSDDGLAFIGIDGSIGYSNSSFRAFVARCGGEAASLAQCFGPKVHRRDAVLESLNSMRTKLPEGGVWSTEITFVDDKDTGFDLRFSTTDGITLEGVERGHVLWVRASTERRRRERFQREILSTTTHDLKGPLGAILISTELIQDMAKDRKDISDLVVRIASSAQGAVNLIEEFLSARRIQDGTLRLKPSHQPLRPIVDVVLGDFAPIAAARSIALEVVCDDALMINVDRPALTRVIGNLVSNALKFTPKRVM